MLFTGDESQKPVSVLSGGERVRCLVAKLMLLQPNVLLLDQPTSHLDLESITALNNALLEYQGTLIFASHDVQFVQSLATRILAISPSGLVDRRVTYEEFLAERAA
jgi:ATPase subunit of ABC transporter with duplicated ATPase domains